MDAWRLLIAAAAMFCAVDAPAVQLGEGGRGQALLFPYFTVQASAGGAFNTYLSIVNDTNDAKAVRVRFREARNSRALASFNVFLSPHDAWAAAIVPGATADAMPRILTVDRSCTSPIFPSDGLPFTDLSYTGTFGDGNGSDPARAREGFVEAIEMATLTGTTAAQVTHVPATGAPADCNAVQGNTGVAAATPGGGLSGTLTLIDVANGFDMSVNAVALDGLATRAFYRPATDDYPDLNAVEIAPVSVVSLAGTTYRSVWLRAADAVSAVLAARQLHGEYVLQAETRSNTDFVVTFPTRQFYTTVATAMPPFASPSAWAADCRTGTARVGEPASLLWHDRDEASGSLDASGSIGNAGPVFCGSTTVFELSNGSAHTAHGAATHVLRSTAWGFGLQTIPVASAFSSGWLRLSFDSTAALAGLVSQNSSLTLDFLSGTTTREVQVYEGLPAIGFAARTLVNGTVACGALTCQASYGAAFPLKAARSIR